MNQKDQKKQLAEIRNARKNIDMWTKIESNLEDNLALSVCPYKPGDIVSWEERVRDGCGSKLRRRRGKVRAIELPSRAKPGCMWMMSVMPFKVRKPGELVRDAPLKPR